MEIKEITVEELENLDNEFTVILFYGLWCLQSKNLKFEIKKIDNNTLNFLSFDVDKGIETTNKFKVNMTPTLVILKDKQVLAKRSDLWTRKNGVIKSNLIIEWINSFRTEEV